MGETTPKKKMSGMTLQLLVSIVAVLLGALLLFVPNMNTLTLCYVFCAALVLLGVILAVRFFVGESFRSLENFQFSAGIMLVFLGICGLINAPTIAESLDLYMGILTLVLGTLMLQTAVRLQAMKNNLWIPELVLAILAYAGSVPILAGIKAILEAAPTYPYWALFIVGILNLVSMLLGHFGFKAAKKNAAITAKKEAETAQHDETL